MKKKIIIDGKTYVQEDGAEGTEAAAAVAADEAAAGAADETVDEAKLDETAQKVLKSLGLDDLKKEVAALKAQSLKNSAHDSKLSALIDLGKLMQKDVSELTSREKIIGFFQAMLQSNTTVLKALAEGVNADGGYLFPDEFRAEIIRDIAETPHMRNEVTVVPMKRDVMNIPTLASGPVVSWTAENAAKTTTTAHFAQATLTVKKMAAILYASDELIEDSTEIDVVNFIIKLFSEVIGNEEDRVITAGNGTTEPTGYSGSGTNIATRSCSGNLDFDDLTDLEYDLPQKYHANAKWYLHRTNIKELRKIKDSQGRYIWQDAVAAGQPATFHGYAAVEDNNLPESKIFFGDLKKAYWLGDRKMMTVKISQDTETAFTKDQTAIRVVARIAGNVVNNKAVKALINIP